MTEKSLLSSVENGRAKRAGLTSPNSGLGGQAYTSIMFSHSAIFGPSHCGPMFVQLYKVSRCYLKIGTVCVKRSVEKRGSGRIWRSSNATPKGRIYPTSMSCQELPRRWLDLMYLSPSKIWPGILASGSSRLKSLLTVGRLHSTSQSTLPSTIQQYRAIFAAAELLAIGASYRLLTCPRTLSNLGRKRWLNFSRVSMRARELGLTFCTPATKPGLTNTRLGSTMRIEWVVGFGET